MTLIKAQRPIVPRQPHAKSETDYFDDLNVDHLRAATAEALRIPSHTRDGWITLEIILHNQLLFACSKDAIGMPPAMGASLRIVQKLLEREAFMPEI